MAFVQSVKDMLPGITPGIYSKREAVATNVGDTTVTIPSSGNIDPVGITAGRIRVKTVTVGVNSTSKVKGITATDGTTTIQLYGGDSAASAAGTGIDEVFDFRTDLKLTSISVVITVATANCTHDVEVSGSH